MKYIKFIDAVDIPGNVTEVADDYKLEKGEAFVEKPIVEPVEEEKEVGGIGEAIDGDIVKE